MKTAIIQLETLTCPSCMQKIENSLRYLEGVDKESIKVSFASSKVSLDFDQEKINDLEIEKAISRLGYQVLKTKIK